MGLESARHSFERYSSGLLGYDFFKRSFYFIADFERSVAPGTSASIAISATNISPMQVDLICIVEQRFKFSMTSAPGQMSVISSVESL